MTPPIRTLQDLAKLCGVSRQAVSAALNLSAGNRTRISKEKGEMIREMAKLHNFRPNRAAQKLHSGRHDAFGLLVGEMSLISLPTMSVLLSQLKKAKKTLMIDSFTAEDRSTIFLNEDCVDALITFDTLPDDMLEKLENHTLPIVHVNTNHAPSDQTLHCDEKGAIDIAVDHFKALGCQNICLVQPDRDHYSSRERVMRFRSHMRRKSSICLEVLKYSGRLSEEALQGFMEEHPEADAFIFGNGLDAATFSYLSQKMNVEAESLAFFWPGLLPTLPKPIPYVMINPDEQVAAILEILESALGKKARTSPALIPYEVHPLET